jgi:hypothetical protein
MKVPELEGNEKPPSKKSEGKNLSNSLEELLLKTLDSIECLPVRTRIRALIEDSHLTNPLTRNTLQKEAREMLNALRGEGDGSENRRD